jgi:hypothetical protein
MTVTFNKLLKTANLTTASHDRQSAKELNA